GLSGVLDRRAEEIVVDPVYGRRPPLGVPANADLTRFVENAVAEARGEGPAGRVRASLLSEGSEILGGAGPLADLLVSVESRSPADDAVLREEVYSVFRQRLNGRYGYRVGREGSALWVQRGDGREPGVRLWVGGGSPWGVFLRWSRETLERLRDRVAVLRFGREVETTAEARALVLDALRVDRYTNGPLGDFQRVLLFGEGKGRVAGAALPGVLRGEPFRQYIEKLAQRVRGFVGSDDAKSNAAYLDKIRRDGGRPHSLINDALVGLAERGFWGQGAYAFLTVFFVPWVEEWIFRRAVFDSPLIGAALSMVGWADASWLPLFQWFIAVPVFVLAHRALNKESWPDTLSRVLPALLFTAAYVAAPGEEWNTLLHAFWNGAALVFGRGPTMSVVGGSGRSFTTPVLASPYVEYALAIHRVVNPRNREGFTAVYGGAGADVSNAFPALNPTNAYFISLYPRWLTADVLRRKFAAGLDAEERETLEEYRRAKEKFGFSRADWLETQDRVLLALVYELEGLGVQADTVRVGETAGGRPVLTFPWRHPTEAVARPRRLVLVNADVTRPDTYADVLDEPGFAVDAYFQNAGLEIPRSYLAHDESFLARAIAPRAGPRGLFFVTDDVIHSNVHGVLDYEGAFPILRAERRLVPEESRWMREIIQTRQGSLEPDGSGRFNDAVSYGAFKRVRFLPAGTSGRIREGGSWLLAAGALWAALVALPGLLTSVVAVGAAAFALGRKSRGLPGPVMGLGRWGALAAAFAAGLFWSPDVWAAVAGGGDGFNAIWAMAPALALGVGGRGTEPPGGPLYDFKKDRLNWDLFWSTIESAARATEVPVNGHTEAGRPYLVPGDWDGRGCPTELRILLVYDFSSTGAAPLQMPRETVAAFLGRIAQSLSAAGEVSVGESTFVPEGVEARIHLRSKGGREFKTIHLKVRVTGDRPARAYLAENRADA
ncbi:MAG TPA: hypothetical protein PLM37_06285, partial [Elusimicrobiota bacterium]|nr:hypothetical protein [Elusimicrobiota bacterium]